MKKENDKLVTVAIHSYEKAQILKSILESEGIPAVINGINLIQPAIPGNVRVRINESDLEAALKIIEGVDLSSEDESEEEDKLNKVVLIPVDFSDYSLVACKFGFQLAKDLNCSVKLMHVFFTPFYPASVPFGDSFTIQSTDSEVYIDIKEKTEKEMETLVNTLKEKIASGDIADVSFDHFLYEGLPEEEIINYSKKHRPMAIVMGTRGKNARELDLIGSVTAEVMDGCRTPIFGIPEESKVKSPAELKKVVFLTNFQQREFDAFDIMVKYLGSHDLKVYIAHITKKDDVWDEIKLSGFQKSLEERYPNIKVEYKLIDQSESLEVSLDTFVKENDIDLISLSSSRRNIFARMFNPGIARKMLFHSDTPLLVIKGHE
ncbi:MAG: universal stress protein [Fermentimonas sp.]|jgi:nucleotide-binding universal stress UspA family protein